MKIIVEANIPYLRGLLEPFGEVRYLSAPEIDAAAVRDAHTLFVRTRTRCDASLLEGSSVRFIATATIGTDHIDLDYCRRRGITVTNAPGCNAPAVAQYVLSTIGHYLNGSQVAGLTLGVVGVGHVGSIVARWGEALGMKVLRCDPPRQRLEGGNFCSLDLIAREAEIITFHTPLTHSGDDATFHLADSEFMRHAEQCRLLINAARGGVVDEQAVVEALQGGTLLAAAIDCWEHEPDINPRLLQYAFVATPHIAGYSAEGKCRAVAMTLDAFERHYGVTVKGKPVVDAPLEGVTPRSIGEVMSSYNPLNDTSLLQADPSQFEALRNGYRLRKEVR